MTTLTEIANRSGTDKGTVVGHAHGYSILYDLLWSAERDKPLNILEIGLCIGGPELETGSADRDVVDAPSVKMWREYFPKAHIYGADISDFSKFENDWFRFVQADAGDPAQLAKIAALGVQFDIIIDDGSHAAFHQQQTLLSLFPLLKPGGAFVIEDLQWQPTEYTATLPKVPNTDVLLRRWADTGQLPSSEAFPSSTWAPVIAEFEQVMLFDTDWLNSQRDQFNRQYSVKAVPPQTYRPPIRAIIGEAKSAISSRLVGSEMQPARGVKLAIIRKKQ